MPQTDIADKASEQSAWASYAPEGSKRRQVLNFLRGNGSGGPGSSSPPGPDSGPTSADAHRDTDDNTKSLASFFSKSQRGAPGESKPRGRGLDRSLNASKKADWVKFSEQQRLNSWVNPQGTFSFVQRVPTFERGLHCGLCDGSRLKYTAQLQ